MSKKVSLGSLKPGTLCHLTESMGEETRLYFLRIPKNRKKKLVGNEKGNERTLVPVTCYGLIQGLDAGKKLCGRFGAYSPRGPRQWYIDSRYLVEVRTRTNWKPRGTA